MKALPFSISAIALQLSLMASTTALQSSFPPLIKTQDVSHLLEEHRATTPRASRTRTKNLNRLRVFAAQEPFKPKRAPPGVDTRIHWDNEDEGWIGGTSTSSQEAKKQLDAEEAEKNLLGEKFADLLNDAADSHYQFLGVSAEADLEEIKAAYRRLSKEYHPDTTSLPLKTASEKFMKLRQVYDVLSNEEDRKFYDWTLAQEAASRKAEKMRMRLEDPYVQDLRKYESIPDTVDRLGGKNIALGDQAMTALTIDVVIIIFAICCIIYAIYFKEPYY